MIETRFKKTDIGEIPEDWEVKGIGSFLSIGNGRDYKHLKRGSIPVYGTGGIMTYVDQYLYNGETVCIGRKGTIDNPLYHKGAIWTVDTLFYTYNFIDCVVKYIYYKFLLIDWPAYNEATGVPSLSKINIAQIQVSLPPLKEQQQIAIALSDVDALLSALNKKIVKKKLIKQGVMQQLLTGKKRLAGFTEPWEEKKLGEISNIYRGGSPRPIDFFITDNINGVNWIKIGDVTPKSKYINKTVERIKLSGVSHSRRVYKGDFILSNSMSFGRPYILNIDGCIHDGWLVIQDYHEYCYLDFLYYVLSSEFILNQYKSMAAGSSVQNLNKEKVAKVILYIPSLKAEQTAIATILSDMDKEIEELEVKRKKYEQVKQGMMQQLLTGKIRLVASV